MAVRELVPSSFPVMNQWLLARPQRFEQRPVQAHAVCTGVHPLEATSTAPLALALQHVLQLWKEICPHRCMKAHDQVVKNWVQTK